MGKSDLISALVTLLAAFLGAYSAFKLEDRSRKRKRVEDNIAAGNRAIFMLTHMFTELYNIQQQLIEPVRDNPAKSIVMLPLLTRSYDDLRFDFDKLTFLLDTVHRQVLIDLVTEEDRFQAAVRVLNERSNLHLREVQPLLEKAGIVEGGGYTKGQIELALGHRIFTHIERASAEVISHIDQTVNSILKMSNDLNKAMTALYPKAKFIRFEPKKITVKEDKYEE